MSKKLKDYDLSKLTEEEKQVLDFLLKNASYSNPVTSRTVKRALGISPENLRAITHSLRMKMVQVCSDSRGYHIAQSSTPVKKTINHLRSRAREMSNVANKLEQSLGVEDHVEKTLF